MTGLLMILAGAGVGLGVMLIIAGLQPKSRTLAEINATLERPGRSVAELEATVGTGSVERGWRAVLGRRGVELLESLSFVDLGATRAQLAVIDRPLEEHAARRLGAGIAGLTGTAIVMGVLLAAGVELPPGAAIVVPLFVGYVGFLLPERALKADVAKARNGFRYALASYLDLVVVTASAGISVDQALLESSASGDGWAFRRIERTLLTARRSGKRFGRALEDLGDELEVTELHRLGRHVAAAGERGVSIVETLESEADMLRSVLAMETDSTAERRTESMVGPVAGLVAALMLFVAGGAVMTVSSQRPTSPQVVTVSQR